jgi:hypothetical protein
VSPLGSVGKSAAFPASLVLRGLRVAPVLEGESSGTVHLEGGWSSVWEGCRLHDHTAWGPRHREGSAGSPPRDVGRVLVGGGGSMEALGLLGLENQVQGQPEVLLGGP